MEASNATTKPRQFEIMIEFMNKHSQLARGHLKTPNARQSANILWQTLTEELNINGPPIREAAGWKKIWADFKVHTKEKLRRNKTDIGGTGGGPSIYNLLSPLEEQVVKLINMTDSVNGLPGALSFGTTTASNLEKNGEDMAVMEQLDEVPSQELATEVIFDSEVATNVSSQSCERNPKKRSRSVSFCHRDNLLKKQVENEIAYQKECMASLKQIKKNVKSLSRYQRKIFEIREKELDLARQKLEFKKRNAIENRNYLKQKLELKKMILDIKEQKIKLK